MVIVVNLARIDPQTVIQHHDDHDYRSDSNTTTKTTATTMTSADAIRDFLTNASPFTGRSQQRWQCFPTSTGSIQTFRGQTEANALEFVMDVDFPVDRALWILLKY